jgi:hypothetical protein
MYICRLYTFFTLGARRNFRCSLLYNIWCSVHTRGPKGVSGSCLDRLIVMSNCNMTLQGHTIAL